MIAIEQIGKPCVALLNPFRGAFHGGAKVFLSETETRKNHGIRRQRTTKKGTRECGGATESVACGATFGRSNQGKSRREEQIFYPLRQPTARRAT
ncbi:hypothetical protein DXA19_08240 [Firmicutes bacterium AM59-13]|nr:hypothetical protein DXA19_08240 [Firmicutes bacterium AM59-13]